MIALFVSMIAAVLLALGATLFAFSKSGEQGTLGGVMMTVGIVAGVIGGLCWWAGL